MTFDGKSKRLRTRLELTLPVRVHCRESEDHEWMEMTRLIDVTPFGARLSLSRPTEPGRLMHLTLPMPRQLRCFDHAEQQYRVWALVRNIKPQPPEEKKLPRFEVGVAFIGKRPPSSYDLDPTRRYEVAQKPTESGMWNLREQPERVEQKSAGPDVRTDTRHPMAVDMIVEVFDEKGRVCASETSVTENLSRRGAAVFTTLKVGRGRFVRLTSLQYGISVIAAVRARRTGANGITRLHLEFVDRQWPID